MSLKVVIPVDPKEEGVSQEEIDHAVLHNNGIVSCKFYKLDEIPDDDLAIVFENDPDWVMELRPDWVQRFHPHLLN